MNNIISDSVLVYNQVFFLFCGVMFLQTFYIYVIVSKFLQNYMYKDLLGKYNICKKKKNLTSPKKLNKFKKYFG